MPSNLIILCSRHIYQYSIFGKACPRAPHWFKNAENAIKFNQEVYFVTERAVFELTHKGLKLIEIAPGLDLEQDILANMAFRPILSDDIKLTQSDIYQAHWGGLAQAIKSDYRI